MDYRRQAGWRHPTALASSGVTERMGRNPCRQMSPEIFSGSHGLGTLSENSPPLMLDDIIIKFQKADIGEANILNNICRAAQEETILSFAALLRSPTDMKLCLGMHHQV